MNYQMTNDQIDAIVRDNQIANTIIKYITTYANLSITELQSNRKSNKYAKARSIIAFLIRKNTKLSYPDIGRLLNKNHSTIILAVRRLTIQERQIALSLEQFMNIKNTKFPLLE